ncbi:MAG: sigma-70 family RNA polymerase sigma factor [Phycisphaerales bacterium]|nr:sigma-70 family RNA polymerase sigma factor [Phycisphaerales bacterium]
MANTTGLVVAAVRRTIGGGHRPADLELEDIVQAVYLKLLRNDFRLLRSFNPDRASMSTWLTLVSRSTAIDALRRQRPLHAQVDEATPDKPPAESPAEAVSLPLHILTARQRLVLTLLFDDDRSVPDAAKILGVNEQTVRSTKHKALDRLRSYFRTLEEGGEAHGDDPEPATVET